MLVRTASASDFCIGRSTSASQFPGRSAGQSAVGNAGCLAERSCRLLQGQSRPLLTSPARTGLAWNVPAQYQKMAVILHGKTLEPPLVQVPAPGGVVMGMMTTDVGHAHPAHQPAKLLPAARPEDQVPVIGRR